MMATTRGTVSVHALSAGYLTLPEHFFVTPLDDPNAKNTVPSLSFLIEYQPLPVAAPTRIIFDLGIRRDISLYPSPIQKHAATRQPVSGTPDVLESLAAGGLTANDIDFIILSHIHWDHIGMPSDFQRAKFVIGHEARDLLNGEQKLHGSHNHFEADLLPPERTIFLADPNSAVDPLLTGVPSAMFSQHWQSKGTFPATIDLFGDGSLYVVSAPGHLPGHISLLCRVAEHRYVYLAGDACHDRRLLTGEKKIATWVDETGNVCCVHVDTDAAKETLANISRIGVGDTDLGDVEVIFAHDAEWEKDARARKRFFPGAL